MTGIADTGFLVAFANRQDRFFPWAFALAQNSSDPLRTCEAVLAETAFHLRDSALALKMVDSGLVRVEFEIGEHLAELAALAQHFRDRTPDLADLCLIRMSQLFPDHPVITVDGDFKTYRRNKRQLIATVMPPEMAS
jgi:predicted nucleic acid-binding protein